MKGKRIKQINNLIIYYTDNVCLEDRLSLEDAIDFCKRTKDFIQR